jgi:hypothetical protein
VNEKDHRRLRQQELRKQWRQAIEAFIRAHSANKLRQQTPAQLRKLLSESSDLRLKKVSIEDLERVLRQRTGTTPGVKS